jgi:hypothetical protein
MHDTSSPQLPHRLIPNHYDSRVSNNAGVHQDIILEGHSSKNTTLGLEEFCFLLIPCSCLRIGGTVKGQYVTIHEC